MREQIQHYTQQRGHMSHVTPRHAKDSPPPTLVRVKRSWDAEPVHGLERLALGSAVARTKFREHVPASRMQSIRELVHAIAGLRERDIDRSYLLAVGIYRATRIGRICHV